MIAHIALFTNLKWKTYIHIKSDHPPQIITKILRSTEKGLSNLSSTKEIFENSKDYYEQRLIQCGYNEKLNYTEANNEKIQNLGSATYFGSIHLTANQPKLISVNDRNYATYLLNPIQKYRFP